MAIMLSLERWIILMDRPQRSQTPSAMTYASVVSRETVRIALTIAALNSLDVKTGDVMNAYITAPITEKVWTILGPEFGADKGQHAIIVRALYGLKSAGAAFAYGIHLLQSGSRPLVQGTDQPNRQY
jgi:hypothetical protein